MPDASILAAALQAAQLRPALTEIEAQIGAVEAELLELARHRLALETALAGAPTAWGDAHVAEVRRLVADRCDDLCLQLGRLHLERALRAGARADARAPEPRAVSGELPRRVPSEPLRVPGPPPDANAVERLRSHLSGTASDQLRRRAAVRFDPSLWRSLLDELGPVPPSLDREPEVRAELRRLLRAVRPERAEQWVALPPELQRNFISVIAARARCLQEPTVAGLVADLDPDRELNQLFSGLSGYLKREQPGFVHGLSRTHLPDGATWREDAFSLWERLTEAAAGHDVAAGPNPERALHDLDGVLRGEPEDDHVVTALQATIDAGVAQDDPRLIKALRPWLDLLGKHARFKVLRKAIRTENERDLAEASAPPPTAAIAADWPCWVLTRNRRAVMVGGEPREEARARLQATFGFAELQWGSIDQTRQLDSLADSLRQGGWDLLILLQGFVNHKSATKVIDACKDGPVPFVSVERGYGVERIREAIEQDLGRRVLAAELAD